MQNKFQNKIGEYASSDHQVCDEGRCPAFRGRTDKILSKSYTADSSEPSNSPESGIFAGLQIRLEAPDNSRSSLTLQLFWSLRRLPVRRADRQFNDYSDAACRFSRPSQSLSTDLCSAMCLQEARVLHRCNCRDSCADKSRYGQCTLGFKSDNPRACKIDQLTEQLCVIDSRIDCNAANKCRRDHLLDATAREYRREEGYNPSYDHTEGRTQDGRSAGRTRTHGRWLPGSLLCVLSKGGQSGKARYGDILISAGCPHSAPD